MTALHAIAELWAGRLLNSIAEGLLIAVLAWALLKLAGKHSSGMRFAIWFSALVLIAALPFVRATAGATATNFRPEIAIASSSAIYIFAAWAFLAAIALARVAVGLLRVRKLREGCTPIEDFPLCSSVPSVVKLGFSSRKEPQQRAGLATEDTEEHRGIHRRVQICVSDNVRVPTAVGFFRPMVVIPSWALEQLSPAELRSVVLHEMAHLRRWDDWSNVAQKLIRALFFFHPAVWWIDNRLTLEREMACDDLVLAQTSDPRTYAECLVSVAEKNLFRRGLAMAQAAVGRIKHMSLRVARILEHQPGLAKRSWKPATALLATVSAVGAFAIARTTPLVGFENLPQPTSVAFSAPGFGVATAMVVPASLNTAHTNLTRPAKKGGGVAPNRVRPRLFNGSAVVIPARAKARISDPSRRPAVIQAKAQPQNSPASFLVVETSYYAGTQEMVWTMTVWQVQAGSAQHKQVVAGVIPRSI